MRTVLQIPITKELRGKAEKVARDELGFSSIQELVRVILSQVASKRLQVRFEPAPVKLSAKAERRYAKMTQDFEKGKDVYRAATLEEFFKQLHEG